MKDQVKRDQTIEVWSLEVFFVITCSRDLVITKELFHLLAGDGVDAVAAEDEKLIILDNLIGNW